MLSGTTGKKRGGYGLLVMRWTTGHKVVIVTLDMHGAQDWRPHFLFRPELSRKGAGRFCFSRGNSDSFVLSGSTDFHTLSVSVELWLEKMSRKCASNWPFTTESPITLSVPLLLFPQYICRNYTWRWKYLKESLKFMDNFNIQIRETKYIDDNIFTLSFIMCICVNLAIIVFPTTLGQYWNNWWISLYYN